MMYPLTYTWLCHLKASNNNNNNNNNGCGLSNKACPENQPNRTKVTVQVVSFTERVVLMAVHE